MYKDYSNRDGDSEKAQKDTKLNRERRRKRQSLALITLTQTWYKTYFTSLSRGKENNLLCVCVGTNGVCTEYNMYTYTLNTHVAYSRERKKRGQQSILVNNGGTSFASDKRG